MKTYIKEKKPSFNQFLKHEIKNPQAIQGGTSKGPIERDKLRRPRRG